MSHAAPDPESAHPDQPGGDADTIVLTETGPDPQDERLLDDEWVTGSARRSRLRPILLGLLVVAVAFLGGVEVQKRWGSGSTATTSASLPAGGGFPGAGSALPSGFPSGGAGAPGGLSGAPGAAAGATGSGASGTSGTSSGPAVIGTVVRRNGTTWTVRDLGGHLHQVTVTAGTTITQEKQLAASGVRRGATVSIDGTTAGNGSVQASAVTVR